MLNFWKELLTCGFLCFSNLRQGVFLLSCLVWSKVTWATGGHLVFAPHVVRSLASPFPVYQPSLLMPCCQHAHLLHCWKHQKRGDFTSTQMQLMKACQGSSRNRIWKFYEILHKAKTDYLWKQFVILNTYYKNLLSQWKKTIYCVVS